MHSSPFYAVKIWWCLYLASFLRCERRDMIDVTVQIIPILSLKHILPIIFHSIPSYRHWCLAIWVTNSDSPEFRHAQHMTTSARHKSSRHFFFIVDHSYTAVYLLAHPWARVWLRPCVYVCFLVYFLTLFVWNSRTSVPGPAVLCSTGFPLKGKLLILLIAIYKKCNFSFQM